MWEDDSAEVKLQKGFAAQLAGCEAGWYESCLASAILMASNKPLFSDVTKASAVGALGRKQEASTNPAMREAALIMEINACRFGAPEGCARLAAETADAPDAPDAAHAVETLTKGCDANRGEACRRLAFVTAIGVPGVTPNVTRGVELWAKACAAGSSDACFNEAVSYLNAGGVPKDLKRGTAALEKACKGGYQAACHSLTLMKTEGSPDVSISLFQGTSARRSDTWNQAHTELTAQCRAGFGPSCWLTGRMRVGETSSKAEAIEARELLELGCNAGHATSCSQLVTVWWEQKSNPQRLIKTFEYAEKSCAAAQGAGCVMVGWWNLRGVNPDDPPKDERKAEEYLRKGCFIGDPVACNLMKQRNLCARRGFVRSTKECEKLNYWY